MRLSVTFDVGPPGLEATHLARLLLDLQHLAIITVASTRPSLGRADIVFDPYKQSSKWMAEATGEMIGDAAVTVSRITYQSPLGIELEFKKLPGRLAGRAAEILRSILNHVLFADLEREKRKVQIEDLREDVRRKRIANVASALDLMARIQDPVLRQQFITSLSSSLRPFEDEHPRMTDVTVVED